MKWILAMSMWIISATVLATVQRPEVLIYDGKEVKMRSTPLEDYVPPVYDRSRPQVFKPITSACHRGYIGTWEIRDGKLFLLKILIWRSAVKDGKPLHTPELDVLSVIFPGKEAPLLAAWFSGVLRIPAGKLIMYVSYEPLYEEDTFVFVDRGIVIGKQVFKYDPKVYLSSSGRREANSRTSQIGQINAFEALIPIVVCYKCFQLLSGGWIDVYEVCHQFGELRFSGEVFKTRGIFFPKRLWVPPTTTRLYCELPLSTKGIKSPPSSGTPVEITATIDKDSPWHELIVTRAVPLRAGEKIHKSFYEDSGSGAAPKP